MYKGMKPPSPLLEIHKTGTFPFRRAMVQSGHGFDPARREQERERARGVRGVKLCVCD